MMLNDHGNGALPASVGTEISLTDNAVEGSTILALAPNGAYKQKSDHPALPLSMDEIVQTAVSAQLAGASLLHLHIRDESGLHSLDPDTYRRTIDAITDLTGDNLIIQVTSEAAGQFSPEQQIASIRDVNPECVSIALREIITNRESLSAAQALFHWCAAQQCRPQFILYSEFDLLSYLEYRNGDIIPSEPHSVLFVLGRYTQNQASTTADLTPFLKHLEQIEVPWMVCAFGASEQECLLDASVKGGHMRVGFENNLLNTLGGVANNNVDQLQDIARASSDKGLNLATIKQAREILVIR